MEQHVVALGGAKAAIIDLSKRAEAAEATVIAKAAQVETLVKERRAERKRAEAAEATLEMALDETARLAKAKGKAEAELFEARQAALTEGVARAEAEARVAELERFLKAGREEWLLASKALERQEGRHGDVLR